MKANPFVYGEIVPAAAFADRVVERHRLVTDLASGQKVFLISPRRYGKSSLVRQALADLKRRKIATLEFTVSSFTSYVGFLEGYTHALMTLEAGAAEYRTWFRTFLASVLPDARFADGDTKARRIAFPTVRTDRDAARLAEEVFKLPAHLSEQLGRPVVIALDEFQAIGSFNGGSVEQALRAAVQQQRQVGYVFAGSEPTLMEQMVGPRRPFYKAGPVMRLTKIPADIFAEFVDRQFQRSGLRPAPGLGAAMIDLANNLPYDVQRLAHETWDDVVAERRQRVTADDLHATLRRLLAEQDTMFETVWHKLTLAQRAALRGVVLEQGSGLLSAETRERYRLGGASTVQASLAALMREDLIARDDDGRYAVVDSLMREWVARKTY